MAKQVKRRRGSTAEHATFVGAAAELSVDTDKWTVVVHNGVTPGGVVLARVGDITILRNDINNGENITPRLPRWTTATRPSTPLAGHYGFNTDISQAEYYDGTDWRILG